MRDEAELLAVKLPGLVTFLVCGPTPREHLATSPTLACTTVSHTDNAAIVELSVLSESANGGRTATTIPFLFEQTDYLFNLALDPDNECKPRLLLRGQELLSGRRRIGGLNVYSVPVNFQSEIGYSDVELWLGSRRCFTLRLEIFPTKLDYRTDLLELRADLQMEVRSLVFELYGRTFQTLHRKSGQRPTDIEWLELLRGEFQKLTRALEIIARSPLQHVEVTHVLDRSLRPVRPSAEVRNYLRRNSSKCVQTAKGHFTAGGRSWLSPEVPRMSKTLTPNTAENRFVASTISRIRSRLGRLQSQLAGVPSRERFAQWTNFLTDADRKLHRFQTQTFLANLPAQQSHPAPTLALHLTSGYREFFSSSLALESVLEVGGGPLELPEKDLATLYELWCFVALASILRQELGLTPRPPTWLRVTQRRVALELVQGKTSVLSLERDGEECVRVVYNREDPTPTGNCRPDNTLEIFKHGARRPFRYVFDAKYRLQDDPDYIRTHHAPGPPPEAIHRMHAYRDQIVAEQAASAPGQSVEATVWDLGYRQWVQQTVGAFVLYPYAGADADKNRFVEAIGKVGVGGVPFLPSRRGEVTHLLRNIIQMSTDAVEDTAVGLSTTDERKRIEWAHEYGLIAIVPSREQLEYILRSGIYHTPYDKHRKWGLRLRADFILFLLSESKFPDQSGVAYQAEIKSLHFGDRREIIPPPPPSQRGSSETDRYVWFTLTKTEPLPRPLTYTGQPPRFAFTTRLAFKEASNVAELILIREPERRFCGECRLAGFDVAVYDESSGTEQVFDVGQLRLRFSVKKPGGPAVTVRFDPWTARFSGFGFEFTWSELMFRPKDCLAKALSS
ncbi:MAG: restriction endonuclease-like protein [bacterium]|uniref:Restriction endonuclease-like protein n=1 Tax=Candidatus Methylomirabilis tolerans TaxID=3123416 RepID=A0AAJ1AHM6_9BACT|nr:restriction endonuclease-like protein [Candidatus Methylomirabilis sp.]